MAESRPVAVSGAAGPSFVAEAPVRVRPNARLIALLALGHLVIDVNQGSLPAVLPFLKTAYALSYTQAGTIVLVAHVMSSIIQPVFGYLADQTARRWLLPVSVLVSGVGIALTGLAPGYGGVLLLVLVMGLGVAAYHPEGFKAAAGVAGDRKATALSWFSLGGNIGIALGPPIITMLVTGFGVTGTLGMVVPTAVVTAFLLTALPLISRSTAVPTPSGATPARGVNMPRAMAILVLVVTVRAWTQLGFTTFVPFYYVDYLRADPRLVGPLLFVFLGTGALGTLLAGPLADRWGARPIMRWAFLAALPLGVLFLCTSGALAFVALGLFGGVLVSTFTISVVLAQAYLPRTPGMASGLIVGFAIGAGGLGVSILGWFADHYGLPATLWLCALLPLLGFAVALNLPAPQEAK